MRVAAEDAADSRSLPAAGRLARRHAWVNPPRSAGRAFSPHDVQLGRVQRDLGAQVHPGEQHDHGRERTVDFAGVPELPVGVEPSEGRERRPRSCAERGPWPLAEPASRVDPTSSAPKTIRSTKPRLFEGQDLGRRRSGTFHTTSMADAKAPDLAQPGPQGEDDADEQDERAAAQRVDVARDLGTQDQQTMQRGSEESLLESGVPAPDDPTIVTPPSAGG